MKVLKKHESPEMADVREINDYQSASRRVEEHIKLHIGENFELDDMCRWVCAVSPQGRKWVATRLGELVGQQVLEKSGAYRKALYKYVDRTKKIINWTVANANDELPIAWPKAHGFNGFDDNSTFGFDGHITVRPGDLIVVSGVSNMGKSVFCRNFLAENLPIWSGLIQMMVSEYAPGRFKSTINRMQWVDFCYTDGTPRFELIERHADWKYAIEPDWINIIDWIGLDDAFYKIGNVMEGIQEQLSGGIAVVVLQKNEGKSLGMGGTFSEHRASVYFNIDKDLLTVRKVKEYKSGFNPNGAMYGYSIVNSGAEYASIRPVKRCSKCVKWANPTCKECEGKGYVDR